MSKVFKIAITVISPVKHHTWNAMLLTLLIIFGAQVLRANGQLDWSILIIPISVFLFSFAAKLLKH